MDDKRIIGFHILYKKEMNLRLSPESTLMIVIGRFEMDM